MNKSIIVIGLLLVSIFGFSACTKKPASTGPTPRARKVDKDVNKEPLENRPFAQLIPRSDAKAVTFNLVSMKKTAKDVEYEIEYESGSLVQGAFGVIDNLSKLPVSKEILLGSCSSGGKCTYNTNVTGGTMTLRFGSPDFTLKNEWAFIEKASAAKQFTSRDGKFSLDVSKAKNSAGVVIVYQTPGYPGEPGSVIAGPYAVSVSGTVTGTTSVMLRVGSDVTSGTIMAWDGKTWKELKTTLKDGQAKAEGVLAQVYVVVKK